MNTVHNAILNTDAAAVADDSPTSVRQPVRSVAGAGRDTVVLAGALRSGTTLFRLMLGGHSQLKPHDEHDFLTDVLNVDGTEPSPQELAERLKTHRVFQSHNIFLERGSNYESLLTRTLTPLRRGGTMPVVSLHRNFERVWPYFSDARYIHLVRDPRDVALSSVNMGWNGNAHRGVDHWVKTEQSWQALSRVLRPDQQLTVHYEAMVQSPETVLREICDFLDIPYESEMLTSYTSTSTYKAIDPGRQQRWRTEMSESDLARFEGKIEQPMRDAGYTPATEGDLKRPGPLMEAWIDLHDRIGRNIRTVKRYSLWLVVTEKLSRWLGMSRWNASVRHRMNIIENTHIV